MRCGLLLSCHSEDNLTILLLWVRHSTWCPFQASLNANCSYQRRLNKGFQLWITDDFILPQSPYIKGYPCLGHKWEEKEGDTPSHKQKPQLCLMCQKTSKPHNQHKTKVLRAKDLRTTTTTTTTPQFYTEQLQVSVLLLLFIFPNQYNCFCSDTVTKLLPAMRHGLPDTLNLYSAIRASFGRRAKLNACLKNLEISQHNLIPLCPQPYTYHRQIKK